MSNSGGVESGNHLSSLVASRIRFALGPYATKGTAVETSKQTVLAQAKQSGDSIGSGFLMIGSFAIIAGILLLVNIFVMLSEERKPELGMLRAVGMRRGRLVRSFYLEGAVYALAASLLGIVAGIGVGRAVAVIAERIYSGYDVAGSSLHVVFHVTPISLINGFAMGALIALATVALTSLRISRINIIAAIRDLPPQEGRRMKRRWVIASAVLAAMFGALSLVAIAGSNGVGTYLFPALALICLWPTLLRVAPKRLVYSGTALAVIAWTLVANTVRPHVLDSGGGGPFVFIGVLLTFAAVLLLSQNQEIVTAPLRPLIDRASQVGLSTRLAVAYPLGRRFRTGAHPHHVRAGDLHPGVHHDPGRPDRRNGEPAGGERLRRLRPAGRLQSRGADRQPGPDAGDGLHAGQGPDGHAAVHGSGHGHRHQPHGVRVDERRRGLDGPQHHAGGRVPAREACGRVPDRPGGVGRAVRRPPIHDRGQLPRPAEQGRPAR